ncbi:hypothetical protein IE81DRAFT_324546 [Ceraceosorus guamensis]|uniref:LysM domain-containing protein n=1 Tax=Ceraceosorus guamensis TaxID=1522189 RepID=A0A316VWW2_9BASI|nr:hypothetical protein IE81DRAFT_324546 [Ceraceosorus guamensis]PWN41408.1 hypothetical protein IE81DRAFT_324546 [Ceraceosorus guamensis]
MSGGQPVCMTCSKIIYISPVSSDAAQASPSANTATLRSAPFVHSCCGRKVCSQCVHSNARLVTFCPLCEDVNTAFKKGPRGDVLRSGQTLFDLDRALRDAGDEDEGAITVSSQEIDDDESVAETHTLSDPPQYASKAPSVFAIGEEDDGEDFARPANTAASKHSNRADACAGFLPDLIFRPTRNAQPSLGINTTKASGSASTVPGAAATRRDAQSSPDLGTVFETTLAQKQTTTDTRTPIRSSLDEESGKDASTRQYWIRVNDSLASISLRFNISMNALILLNELPASIKSNPSLLHTRSFLLLPNAAVEQALARASSSASDLASALSGPPRLSAEVKTRNARRAAEGRFRSSILRSQSSTAPFASAANGGMSGETPCDDRAARAYIALEEEALCWIDFGEEAAGGASPPSAPDRERLPSYASAAQSETPLPNFSKSKVQHGKAQHVVRSSDAEAEEVREALMDSARSARYDAVVRNAIARWEADSEFERASRAAGMDPTDVSRRAPVSKPKKENKRSWWNRTFALGAADSNAACARSSMAHPPRSDLYERAKA